LKVFEIEVYTYSFKISSGEFAHTYCTCQNCKIIGKVKMETTGMWGLTLIILKDIKCFQIWAYFEGIGINFKKRKLSK
jgi:hypothetical protein